MNYTERTSCRLCGGALRDGLNLGDIHVSSFLDTNEDPTPTVPIDLVQCVDCNVMQLRHTVKGDVMYKKYWYQSGLNNFMVEALRDVMQKTLDRAARYLDPGDVIVDIGSNDGTLLAHYPEWVRSIMWLVGYEPSNLYTMSLDKAHYIINDYFNANAFVKQFNGKKAKIITSVAMFYDLEDPHSFVEDAKSILHEQGVWTIQLMDLLSMVKTRDFPNLCHEHLEYYTLHDICKLLAQHGLQVFDVEYNNVNGSSLRVYVCHQGARGEISPSVLEALENENSFFEQIGDVITYFKNAVEDVRNGVVAYIKYLNNSGERVAVMGASTKGNTILQYFGLTEKDIIHCAEINPDKFGKRTVGSNIPIVKESYSLAQHPDAYLILPWGFLSNFIERNHEYLQSGGKFITPLPTPAVITMNGDTINVWEI
jgi:NDP-4-keto-2,6-dideoxyhexose 3-C-methyltransferase